MGSKKEIESSEHYKFMVQESDAKSSTILLNIRAFIRSRRVCLGLPSNNYDFDLNFLYDYETNIKKIKKEDLRKQRPLFSGLLSVCRIYKIDAKPYQAAYWHLNKQKKLQLGLETFDVPKEKIIQLIEFYAERYESIKKKLNLKRKGLEIAQDYLIILLYTSLARRNIYRTVEIIDEGSSFDFKTNYLVIGDLNEYYFIFQDQKIEQFNSDRVSIVNPVLIDLLNIIIPQLPNDYLITDKKNERYTNTAFSTKLIRLTKAAIGVGIGSRGWRHIAQADPLFKKMYLEKMKLSRDMGHSLHVAQQVYNRAP